MNKNFTNIYSASGKEIFPRAGLWLKAGTIVQKNNGFVTLIKPATIQASKVTVLGDGQGRDKKEIFFSLVESV
jgi:hypothetical protein